MRCFLIVFFLLIHAVVFTQNAKIDSLNKVIATTKVDTVKGRSLCRLCWEYKHIGDFEAALKAGTEGLSIGRRSKDFKIMGNCLGNLGLVYEDQGQYPKALDHYRQALKTYQKEGDKIGMAKIYSNIGGFYFIKKDLDSALKYLKMGMKIREEVNDIKGLAQSYGNLGNIYSYKSDVAKALFNYQKCLSNYEKIKDKTGISKCLKQIARAYDDIKDYNASLSYYQRGLALAEGNDLMIADSYIDIGVSYFLQKKYDDALIHYRKSYELYQKLNYPRGIASGLLNIGTVLLHKKKLQEALTYIQEALAQFEALESSENIGLCWTNLAALYLESGNFPLAKSYGKKAFQNAIQMQYLENIRYSAMIIFQADSALGDYKSAFEHHKLYKQYSDSLNNEEKAKEFGRVESKYQFEKEAEEAKRKQTELAKIEAEATQRRNNLQYLTIFAGIIGLFAGLVFLGKFKIPTRVLDIAIFAGLLILFEFLLILFDPWFDRFSGGIPFYKLGFNTLVAFGFAPLHGFLEGKLKKRLVKGEKL